MCGLLTRRPEWPRPAGEAQGSLQMFGTSLAGTAAWLGTVPTGQPLAASVFLLSQSTEVQGPAAGQGSLAGPAWPGPAPQSPPSQKTEAGLRSKSQANAAV